MRKALYGADMPHTGEGDGCELMTDVPNAPHRRPSVSPVVSPVVNPFLGMPDAHVGEERAITTSFVELLTAAAPCATVGGLAPRGLSAQWMSRLLLRSVI